MSAPQRGLLFRQARLAVEAVDDTHRPQVLDAAAQLLASWWAAAGGYGVNRAELSDLARVALDALVATDDERHGRQL